MRWLLAKDLQILRRSPLLAATVLIYPVAVALLVGFAISNPPAKPKVAIYSGVPTGEGKFAFGAQQLNVTKYAKILYSSVDPVLVASSRAAVADVRSGRTLAAIIIPSDIDRQLQALIETGTGHPTVTVVINSHNPLERRAVQDAIQTRAGEVQQAVAKQVMNVAIDDLQRVLNGGNVKLLGHSVGLLGLSKSRTIIADAVHSLPPGSPQVAALSRVVAFADAAITGLSFATPVLREVATPLTVKQVQLAGRTTPAASYAAAIAVVFLLMFVTLLLAAGMLALERSENAYQRLVRGLIGPSGLLAEKVVLASGCAALESFLVAAAVSLIAPLDWARVELWLVAIVFGAVAFAAMGAAVGAVAREVSVASLLAFLIGLPIALIAVIPSTAVSTGLAHVLNVVSFAFPFRAALQVMTGAFGGGDAGDVPLALLHLVVLTAVFAGLARLALPRLATAR